MKITIQDNDREVSVESNSVGEAFTDLLYELIVPVLVAWTFTEETIYTYIEKMK